MGINARMGKIGLAVHPEQALQRKSGKRPEKRVIQGARLVPVPIAIGVPSVFIRKKPERLRMVPEPPVAGDGLIGQQRLNGNIAAGEIDDGDRLMQFLTELTGEGKRNRGAVRHFVRLVTIEPAAAVQVGGRCLRKCVFRRILRAEEPYVGRIGLLEHLTAVRGRTDRERHVVAAGCQPDLADQNVRQVDLGCTAGDAETEGIEGG